MNAIAELEERLARYPAERYPVQHATAQFHLGVELTNAGRAEEATHALQAAVALFDPNGLGTERAKALNALGAALRVAGRADDAAAAFDEAAQTLRGAERGAALYNLGLAAREAGDLTRARDAFEQARRLLDARVVPVQAAAAAREFGSTILQEGDAAAAIVVLEEALDAAQRTGDESGSGGAANALGLAFLAAGRADHAIAAFRRALAAHPRSVRPGEYAMAKANLALAYEYGGDLQRARLAARQALGVPSAAPAVAEQAQAVLQRVGRGNGDLVAVLVGEPREGWAGLVREEVLRWTDANDKRAELAQWIDTLRAPPVDAIDLAEAWLGALLELPPDAMEQIVAAAVDAAGDRDIEWFRPLVESASARFHAPQLLRLREAFAWS
jgi:tetratricopeptide (TPR) repeat protein